MNPPTYAELVEALRKLSSILWMAEKYAEEGGIFGPENADYAGATHGLDALLAHAESAKLVGTYVWHDVREELPSTTTNREYPVCFQSKETSSAFYDGHHWTAEDGGIYFPDAVTHWAEPLQHPSSLKGATE